MVAPHCFVGRTAFSKPQGGFITASEFKTAGGDRVLGPQDAEVVTLRAIRHPAVERDFVSILCSGCPYPFRVTSGHRLRVVERGEFVDMTALELKRAFDGGSDVHIWGAAQEITIREMHVEKKSEVVVEVTFDEDAVVLAWLLPKVLRRGRPELTADAAVAVLGSRLCPGDFRIEESRNGLLQPSLRLQQEAAHLASPRPASI